MQATAIVDEEEFESHKRLITRFFKRKALPLLNGKTSTLKACKVQAYIDPKDGSIRVFVHDASDLATAVYFRIVAEK